MQLDVRGPRIRKIDVHFVEPAPHDVLVVCPERPRIVGLVRKAQRPLRRHLDRGRNRAVRERRPGRKISCEHAVDGRSRGQRPKGHGEHQACQDLHELRVTIVRDSLPREPVGADAQAVGRLPDRAEVDREAGAVRLERRVREIGPGGHAQHAECRAGRGAQGRRNLLRRQVDPLAQLEVAGDVGDADPEFQLRADLITDRGLDIDGADVGVVAEEPAGGGSAIPFRFKAVRGIQPDTRRELRVDGVGEVEVGNGDQRILQIALGAEEVVGEASLGTDQRDARTEPGARQSGQSRWTEVDGGAVGAGVGGGDAGTPHGARVVFIDAKPLPSQTGGEGGDKRSSTGEQQQRKPPHSVFSKGRIEIDGESGRDTVALRGIIVKPMPRPAIDLFKKTFGTTPRAAASAPGRVNLIGEHTDYNGGPVLPIAIAQRTTVAVGPGAPGDAGVLEAVSTQFSGVARVKWQEELPKGWVAYVGGVLRELWSLEAVPFDGSVRIAVASDVPIGAGLSSSAALAVATAKALAPSLNPRQIAGVAFRAEHDHVGVRCGVMDQTIAALGKRDHALLFECASLEATQIPFDARLLLVDTGKRHDLSAGGGGLNQRRAECEEAVKRLKVELPELLWLASWPAEWLPRLKRALREPLRSRAVHVVSETARTRFAAQLLQQRRLKQFGKLLYESHESCRRLYECSSPELDIVVAAAKRAGALGARLTGAGWGGAAIVLVNKTDRKTIPAIQRAYERAYGRSAAISEVQASAGAHTERL